MSEKNFFQVHYIKFVKKRRKKKKLETKFSQKLKCHFFSCNILKIFIKKHVKRRIPDKTSLLKC